MKKRSFIQGMLVLALFAVISCGGNSNGSDKEAVDEEGGNTEVSGVLGQEKEIPMKEVQVGSKTYNVADITDESHIYKENVKKSDCMIVISKREFRLYVYECGKDTSLVVSFPICYAKYPEAKTKSGDMRTPECSLDEPFTISEIVSASDWEHDFGDGRGKLPAYGDWFIRLSTPGFTGIGIHGSTNNAASVPGRDSEGCIRLRDADIRTFHDLYAAVGQKVVIKSVAEQKYPFEKKAEEALGEKYESPKAGYQQPKEEPYEVEDIDEDYPAEEYPAEEYPTKEMDGEDYSEEGEVG